MDSFKKAWAEKEWQVHVGRILAIHHCCHGSEYVPIPDKVHGDAGLEGFSTDGYGYQCYADQNSLSTADRSKKQCKKIRDDLKKLAKYRGYWAKVLQGVSLRYWILIVPELEDKAVQAVARQKGEEIRKQGLPFIATDFQAIVKRDRDFPEAHQRASELGLHRIQLVDPIVDDKAANAFEKSSRDLVAVLDQKIHRMQPRVAKAERLATRKELLNWHIKGSNLLDQLQKNAPWLWEPIAVCVDTLARSIQTLGRIDTTPSDKRLIEAKEKLQRELGVIVTSSMFPSDVETVVWATITEWLLECPLDFPEVRT